MRLPWGHRHTAARPRRPNALGLLSIFLFSSPFSTAFKFEEAPSANLDISGLGRIALAGDFSGISLYEYKEQTGRPSGTNGSESLVAVLPNGALATLVSTDATIRAMCTFQLKNGEMQGIIIGGNFTSLDGTQSTAIALYNPDTGNVTPLDGLKGEVNAVYCDQDRDTVYVGGNFKGADSTNAIAWYGSEGWTNLPFAGFNGPVESITKAASGHIIFGGSFTGLGNSSSPTEPDGQVVNIATATISSQNTASGSNHSSILCPSSNSSDSASWLLQDKTAGVWDAQLGFGFEPTKLRLWNTHKDGRGTKTFRFTAFPLNGIMNFTYVDPASKENKTCTSECQLSDNSDVEYQDFHFVNRVGMNRFMISISDWYGSGGGLNGIEIFQDNIFSYAINDFNDPSCGSIDFPSKATVTGPWTESPSLESNSKYLTSTLTSNSSAENLAVKFLPNIRESGNYSVDMYTPGCQPDGTCLSRGRVNVTGYMKSGSDEPDFSITLYQTNNFDKYDQIYFGYIENSADNFKPSVVITPIDGESINGQVMVAQRVGFTLINSTGGLNGLYDFNPDLSVVSTDDFQKSAINRLGASFDHNTGVKKLLTSGNDTFIAGNFTSDKHVNIVAINRSDDVRALDGGLNGPVLDMYLNGTQLYVGGEFNNTRTNANTGMNHVAVYDMDKDTWSALGAGVDGRVQYVVPLQANITSDTPETVITLTGSFSKCNKFNDNEAISVSGFAVWVPSQNNWLQNLDGPVPSYSGVLTDALLDIPNTDAIYAGSLSSAQMGASGAASLDKDGLGRFPVSIGGIETSSSSGLSRRDVASDDSNPGVVAGHFYTEQDRNLTIFAGHFTVQPENGSAIHNLVIIDGGNKDSASGLGDSIDANSTFLAMEIVDSVIYAGGRVTGRVGDSNVGGIIAYDLSSKSLGEQPAALSGGNRTVSVISVRPDTPSQLFVGGSFTGAGSLDCPGICILDTGTKQWSRAGGNVGGDVRSFLWKDKKTLLVGGSLKNTSLSIYSPENQSWEDYPSSDKLPGPVDIVAPASSDRSQVWVTGRSSTDSTIFIMKYNGKEWLTVQHSLANSTDIRGLQVFSLTKDHDSTNLLENNHVLMLTGSVGLPDYGVAAAALFNGTAFVPYALTTSSGSEPGVISAIISEKEDFFTSSGNHLALVFVILIGLAISLGLILLLVVGGILLDRLRKRREGYVPAPTSMYDRGSGILRIPPSELLESLGKGKSSAPRV
uniref:Cellular morphogenesis protein n=1 Tax=Bionectria ochroleuca TaxID=29856 RepID=A0A8H7TP82_BIOOC